MQANIRRGYRAPSRRPIQFSLHVEQPSATGSGKNRLQGTDSPQPRLLSGDVFGPRQRPKKPIQPRQTKSSHSGIFRRLWSCLPVKNSQRDKLRQRRTAEIIARSRLRESRFYFGDKSTETEVKSFDTKACQTLDWYGQPFDRLAVGYTNVNSCQPHRFNNLDDGNARRAMTENPKIAVEEASAGIGAQRSFYRNVRAAQPSLHYDYNDVFADEDGYAEDECVEGGEGYFIQTPALADGRLYRNADARGQGYENVDEDEEGEEEEARGDEEVQRSDFRRLYSPREFQDYFSYDDPAERSNYLRTRVLNEKMFRYDSWGTPATQATVRPVNAGLGRRFLTTDNCPLPPTQLSPFVSDRQKPIPLTPTNASYCSRGNLHFPTVQPRNYRQAYVPARRLPVPSERFNGRCLLSHRGAW
ncbi:unnamed protein product [Dibothriocephalus latus]|uniref:Uncharacterized protein n=1 Tax=Dibothriocephalus latus TaxID=60516 RepID=A0A3P7MAM4_DIBLA|nr:unnamed protein product [Dibothriocephalus latus]